MPIYAWKYFLVDFIRCSNRAFVLFLQLLYLHTLYFFRFFKMYFLCVAILVIRQFFFVFSIILIFPGFHKYLCVIQVRTWANNDDVNIRRRRKSVSNAGWLLLEEIGSRDLSVFCGQLHFVPRQVCNHAETKTLGPDSCTCSLFTSFSRRQCRLVT